MNGSFLNIVSFIAHFSSSLKVCFDLALCQFIECTNSSQVDSSMGLSLNYSQASVIYPEMRKNCVCTIVDLKYEYAMRHRFVAMSNHCQRYYCCIIKDYEQDIFDVSVIIQSFFIKDSQRCNAFRICTVKVRYSLKPK